MRRIMSKTLPPSSSLLGTLFSVETTLRSDCGSDPTELASDFVPRIRRDRWILGRAIESVMFRSSLC